MLVCSTSQTADEVGRRQPHSHIGHFGRVQSLGEQTGIRRSPTDRTTAVPCNFMPDEGRHGFSHATGGPSGKSEDDGSEVCAPTLPP